VHATAENIGYLRTKRDRMGHDLPGLDTGGEASPVRDPASEGSPA
jgi:3,4-dihydroxy 2-butanone 4-phosphate synthase/GTP cyclohydrolase II